VATEDVDFYNPHTLGKRDPGIYLDVVERIHAEEQRAVIEGREPDFENLPAGTGTPLVTRSELPFVRVGTAPEVFVTLPVAVDSEDDVQEGTEEHDELRYEANKATLELITEARKERVEREGEAAKAAAENYVAQEKANLDATLATTTNRSDNSALENSNADEENEYDTTAGDV
jgi:hypothetical protein